MTLDETLALVEVIRSKISDPLELRALEQLVRYASRGKRSSTSQINATAHLISVRDDLDRLREKLSQAIGSSITDRAI